MSNPIVITCPADTWTKVATNVTSGVLTFKTGVSKVRPVLHTYRMTGNTAPTDLADAVELYDQDAGISAAAAIDVYVYPKGHSAVVRVAV